ncbi:hypothetical protein [Cronobacter muytjensii]|uniref:hypothetical protein n=1 Tax=Cronobacter muytjensii TaxID=413501 RepID=UPI0003A000F4|nr:hypothetical protein [Cronobacter muytjensii]ALB69911.1 hypothetical protein AFK63_04520 [Cronobacter muytjensii ATCC 51329]ELY4519870.1 DUF2384 domain-containing protein [Cronobacter muytjensii]ELY4664513.1 DUF2384 domain-containing protein [Cronobacter muytjensii]
MVSRTRHARLKEYPPEVSVEFVDVGHLVTSLQESPAPWGRIQLSDIPGEDAGRYLMLKLPDEVDEETLDNDIRLAIVSAVTAVSQMKRAGQGAAEIAPLQARNRERLDALRQTVLEEGRWLSAGEVSMAAGAALKNPSATANRWKQAGKVFALPVNGKDRYPAWAFDEGGQPLPSLKPILARFREKTPWAIALWFHSPNAWLGGDKPKDRLKIDPQAVLDAADVEAQGPVHG